MVILLVQALYVYFFSMLKYQVSTVFLQFSAPSLSTLFKNWYLATERKILCRLLACYKSCTFMILVCSILMRWLVGHSFNINLKKSSIFANIPFIYEPLSCPWKCFLCSLLSCRITERSPQPWTWSRTTSASKSWWWPEAASTKRPWPNEAPLCSAPIHKGLGRTCKNVFSWMFFLGYHLPFP